MFGAERINLVLLFYIERIKEETQKNKETRD